MYGGSHRQLGQCLLCLSLNLRNLHSIHVYKIKCILIIPFFLAKKKANDKMQPICSLEISNYQKKLSLLFFCKNQVFCSFWFVPASEDMHLKEDLQWSRCRTCPNLSCFAVNSLAKKCHFLWTKGWVNSHVPRKWINTNLLCNDPNNYDT